MDKLLTKEFPLQENLVYLNHAAVSPWPVRTSNAVTEFATENTTQGSLNYKHWLTTELHLKEQIQFLINAETVDEIALLKNTSEALSIVAYGLRWKAGDNVVISNQEFPSNRIVWESLANQGVAIKTAHFNGQNKQSPEDEIISLCDKNTRLVALSSIQYASGYRADLAKIGNFCQEQDILFCVDAIQSVGAVDFDVQAYGVDFAMADGHKWMLGPEGLAFFYCHPEARDKLQLLQYGWHMTQDYLNFDNLDWQIASSNRRFECGSPNMLGIHALNASLSLLIEYNIKKVEQSVLTNARYIMDYIKTSSRYELLTLDEHHRYGGIVTFRHKNIEINQLYNFLVHNNVQCAVRGGGIRFSPHFYTPKEKLEQAIHWLETAHAN